MISLSLVADEVDDDDDGWEFVPPIEFDFFPLCRDLVVCDKQQVGGLLLSLALAVAAH
jgi:hypothetical protein